MDHETDTKPKTIWKIEVVADSHAAQRQFRALLALLIDTKEK